MPTESNQTRTMVGWVILHPDGSVETDYFQRAAWFLDGKRVSRERWRKAYRPKCTMIQATLLWDA